MLSLRRCYRQRDRCCTAHVRRVGCSASWRAAGFTLLELLIVIAVLVLLVGILAPSTQQAREGARSLVCQSQLKEIGRAATDYWLNNNGRGVKLHPTECTCFSDAFLPFLNNAERTFCCPSARESQNAAANGKRLDYGMNTYGRAVPLDTFHTTFDNVPVYQVAKADVVYFADSENDSSPEAIGGAARDAGEGVWPIYWSFEKSAYKRHLDGYNCAQLDGAARWLPGWPATNQKWYIWRK